MIYLGPSSAPVEGAGAAERPGSSRPSAATLQRRPSAGPGAGSRRGSWDGGGGGGGGGDGGSAGQQHLAGGQQQQRGEHSREGARLQMSAYEKL